MDITQPIPVADGLWWVGTQQTDQTLQCNPYLMLHGGSAILFDPGSVLDFAVVSEKVSSLIPIGKLDAIVCSHQDPDLCSSLPLFEKAGFTGPYCCHQRTANIIEFYGIKRPFYHVDRHGYRFPLVDGSEIHFLPAPYLHFPGAIMSYLPEQKVLISGDLFGSIGTRWNLFASEGYEETMKTYHEAYMPAHDIMKPVMDQLSDYDIRIICPQHGSIINSEVSKYIQTLRDLQCGVFLNPVRKNLLMAGGYLTLCNQIVKRYEHLFSKKELQKSFANSPFTYSAKERKIVKTSLAEHDVFNSFFNLIAEKNGMSWITVVAPMVELLSKEYAIPLPDLFRTLVFDSASHLASKDSELQTISLQKVNLEKRLHSLEESLYRDPVTGLYNQNFHRRFAKEVMELLADEGKPFHFIMVSIDNLAQINLDFGSAEGDETMRRLAMMIGQHIEETSQAFRFTGAIFGIYCTQWNRQEVEQKASNLLSLAAESEAFIVPITLSIGLFSSTEIPRSISGDIAQMVEVTTQTARYRLKLAQKRGGGVLVADSMEIAHTNTLFTILLIDNPGLGRNLLRRALEKEQYRVLVVDNGLQARRRVEIELPDLIICELMVPKVNAITLRKELLAKQRTRKIPFLLMSYTKNESTVGRALEVRISHFFWRPVMLVELLGVVKLIAARLQIQGN